MKRNKEWAKKLLEYIENRDSTGSGLYRSDVLTCFIVDHGARMDFVDCLVAVDYHLELLSSAGFVNFNPDHENRDLDCYLLTWAGHDFLEGS